MINNNLDLIIGGAETVFEDERARMRFGEYENKYIIKHEYPDIYNGTELVRVFIDSMRFAESNRSEHHELDYQMDYTPIGARRNTINTFLKLSAKERNLFFEAITLEEKYYFDALIHDEIKLIEKTYTRGEGFSDKADVTLVFVCDDAFFLPMCVTIQSIKDTKNNDSKYRVYVITKNLSQDRINSLNIFLDDTFDIICVKFNSDVYDMFSDEKDENMSNVSITALIKFDICNYLDEDKALYLDGDIVVSDDLTELYNKNIDDYVVAAVPDSSVMYMPKEEIYLKDYYFNSGVMLMNLRKMREEKISEKLREMKRSLSDKSLMDQNVFNLVIKDRVERLPTQVQFYVCESQSFKR